MKKVYSNKIGSKAFRLAFLSVVCVSFSVWMLWVDKDSEEKKQNDLVSLILEVFPYLLIIVGIIAGLISLYQGIKKIT